MDPLGTCPRCRTEVLTGVTGRPGIEVVLDPAPLDPVGELDAILDRRATVTRHTLGGQLTLRNGRQITDRPAGTRDRETVLREHRCEVTDR